MFEKRARREIALRGRRARGELIFDSVEAFKVTCYRTRGEVRDLPALDLGPVVVGLLERELVAGGVGDQLVEVLGCAERSTGW
jgi:hypothetical protein